MKKISVRIFLFCFLLISFIPFLSTAKAASDQVINSIEITADLQSNGSADITEVWNISVSSSSKITEWYLPKMNLQGSEISNFKVKDDLNIEYRNIGYDWDIKKSFSEKKNKCGIVKKDNGLELCWGIGDYGKRKFIVSYHVTKLVDSYSDMDGFNWRFVNSGLSSIPENVTLSIYSPFSITDENTDIWMFGNTGKIIFKKDSNGKGYIFATASKSQYNSTDSNMTIVSGFKKGNFSPEDIIVGKTFADVVSKAKEGSSYNNNSSANGSSRSLFGWITYIFSKFFWIVFIIFGVFGGSLVNKRRNKSYIKFSKEELNNLNYYRNVPFEGNIIAAYSGLIKIKAIKKDNTLISAFLLKWLNEGLLQFKETESKGFLGIGHKMVPSIVFTEKSQKFNANNHIETRLFKMMMLASGGDNILQEKELEKYFKSNYEEYFTLLDDAYSEGEAILEQMGVLSLNNSSSFGNIFKSDSYIVTENGKQRLLELLGFKKYLEDFTIINEREATEVGLWDNYLVFAALYGIAEEVAKQFKNINPEYIQSKEYGYSDNMDFFTTLYMINTFSLLSASSATSASSAAAASEGSGGFGSFGGGGGFSGGGFGGGGR